VNVFKDLQIAQKYDLYYQTSLGESVDRIEKGLIKGYLDSVLSREMLELGCGTGHWTQFFCEEGFRVTGVDESDAMLKQARAKNIAAAGFLKADAGKLPFPDQSFSVVSSVTMIEFVDDPERVFYEIDRVLKPGGHFLCGWLNALSEPAKRKDNDETFRHARFYTPEEIGRFLERFGQPHLSYGVYYSPEFELLDGTTIQNSVQPAFIASLVQKI
jgi:ubiquinone/menaquinone biosynthesis C-methylase UbiE